MANKLKDEHSPYLKQHQHNPVHWMPWGEEALEKAKAENKLIIISIGYSACHWCHVMERESFENDAIAQVMNKFFVPIKIDREERPDIDQIYMIAVQLMTNAGGWPLNCICLPDGRPIYGGTYFKPQDWQSVLLQIAQMWENQPHVALEYAEKLTKGIQQAEQLPILTIPKAYTEADLSAIVTPWTRLFDTKLGGYDRAPKFPLPNNWVFLLRYAVLSNDAKLLDFVHFTLQKIASGGIYDQVGGGFARYSVDAAWHIPHFEKMLYDNGQLLSLYAEAYQQQPLPSYKRVVEETITWAKSEMLAPNDGFYCALDADSEGVEGKFYTFTKTEIEEVLAEDAPLFIKYFNIHAAGNWEEEHTNVLICDIDADKMAESVGYSDIAWDTYLKEIKLRLKNYRAARIRPGLDYKQLASWNALMIKGLIDAYRVFQKDEYLTLAVNTANFLRKELIQENNAILHQPTDNKRSIAGFLDDYAFTIEAFTAIYEATFEEEWLLEAQKLADYALANFYDKERATCYYSAADDLIARKSEIMDNVIPSANSTFVRQLKKLGLLFDKNDYSAIADQQFANVFPQLKSYGSAYSNWAIFLLEEVYGTNEIALTGDEALTWLQQLDQHYIPNKITLGGTNSSLPLLIGREGLESKAYLCRNKTCSLPQGSVTALLSILK